MGRLLKTLWIKEKMHCLPLTQYFLLFSRQKSQFLSYILIRGLQVIQSKVMLFDKEWKPLTLFFFLPVWEMNILTKILCNMWKNILWNNWKSLMTGKWSAAFFFLYFCSISIMLRLGFSAISVIIEDTSLYLNPLPHTPEFRWPVGKWFLKTLSEKENIAGNKDFLPFPQCCQSFQKQVQKSKPYLMNAICKRFLDKSEICHFVKSQTTTCYH